MAGKNVPNPFDEDRPAEAEVPVENIEPQAEETPVAPTVRYTGSSSIREITAQQWSDAGAEGQATVVWNPDNNHTVPLEDLSEDARRIVGNEPGFEIVNQE